MSRPGVPAWSRWLVPVAWMAAIAGVSGDSFSVEATGSRLLPWLAWLLPGASPVTLHHLHFVLRKLAHLGEYAVLGGLWLWALGPGRPAAWAVALAAGWALVDEARQGPAASRSASPLDVVLDVFGAVLGVSWSAPGLVPAALRLLQGAAALVAAGSLGAALADRALGLAAWDLLAAGVAALGLAVLLGRLVRRIGRRGSPASGPAV